MDTPRRHGQADNNPMVAVQGLEGKVVLAPWLPWPFHMSGLGVCPADPFLCPPLVFFDLLGVFLPPPACPRFEYFQPLLIAVQSLPICSGAVNANLKL